MADLIGIRVTIPGTTLGHGVLRYIGQIEGKPGVFGGLELQGPIAASRGKNSGSVDGIKYFDVALPMTGLFLPWERLRSANPALPRLDRPQTRPSSVSSRSEMLYTPSPPTRRASSRLSHISETNRLRESGRDSPLSSSAQISVAKRKSVTGASRSPTLSAPALVVGSRTGLGDLFQKPLPLVAEMDAVLRDLAEYKALVNKHTQELQEKNRILDELQLTVSEINPIMEEYEKTLREKDLKYQKQKKDYDSAREEWRQSLDLMLGAQQEAETFYEQQIDDLKEEITRLSTSGSRRDGVQRAEETELLSLREENAKLLLELAEMIQLAERRQSVSKNGLVADSEYVEQLEKKVERLDQDVSSLEFVIEDLRAKSKTKDNQILQLTYKLEEASEKEIDALLGQVGNISVADWEQKEAALQSKLAALEKLVAEHLATIEAYRLKEKNGEAKAKEVEAKEIKALEAKLAALEEQVRELKNLNDQQTLLAGKMHKDTADQDAMNKVKELEAELAQAKESTESVEKRAATTEEKLKAAEEKVKTAEALAKKAEEKERVAEEKLRVAEEEARAAEQKASISEQKAAGRDIQRELAAKEKEEGPTKAELAQKIEDLTHELRMRPSFDELNELHASLEEVDRLHANELYLKDKELTSVQEAYIKATENNQRLQAKLDLVEVPITPLAGIVGGPPSHKLSIGPSPGSGSLPDPEPWAKTDSLPIYEPVTPTDPSSGRTDWCGLCEREGHNSLDCPYENDMF